MRPLSSKQHGFVDYGVAAVELLLPRFLGAGATGRRLLKFSGMNAALLGGVTQHDLGLIKVVPMRVHLALDGAFAAVFLGAALFLRSEPPRVRAALAALGASGALAAALTDPDR